MGLRRVLSKLGLSRGMNTPRDKLLGVLPANAVCAEIGVWKGRFSRMVMERLDPSMYHLIDPWAFQPDFGERMYGGRVARNQDDMDAIFEGVRDLFRGRSNVRFHRMFSSDAVKTFDDDYFDWVYIDGNHHYDYVLEDLQSFYPKVKAGGYIAGDDYTWAPRETPGDLQVKRAVEAFVASMGDRVQVLHVWDDQFVIQKLR